MAFRKIEGGGISIEGTESMKLFRLMTLESGLKLEIKGLRFSRGRTCYAIVKSELGFKGNRNSVLAQLREYISELGEYQRAIQDDEDRRDWEAAERWAKRSLDQDGPTVT